MSRRPMQIFLRKVTKASAGPGDLLGDRPLDVVVEATHDLVVGRDHVVRGPCSSTRWPLLTRGLGDADVTYTSTPGDPARPPDLPHSEIPTGMLKIVVGYTELNDGGHAINLGFTHAKVHRLRRSLC